MMAICSHRWWATRREAATVPVQHVCIREPYHGHIHRCACGESAEQREEADE